MIIKFVSHPKASIGRMVTAIIKKIKEIDTKQIKEYIVDDVENLSFSKPMDTLVAKYKLKYNAGGPIAGPYYRKDPAGLFKLIYRTMLKYKTKHKDVYKKLKAYSKPVELDCNEIKLNLKENTLSQKVTLKELFKRI